MKVVNCRKLKAYQRDKSGQFGLWLALLAFPVMLSASMVVDMRAAESHRSSIQRALDVTSMAVASNNEMSNAQKLQFADSVFANNYNGPLDVNLDVAVDVNTVELNATAEMPTSMNGALGKSTIEIALGSKAAMQQKNTICVLALAQSGANRVSFLGRANFDSPTCAVQANSSHHSAILATSSHVPHAKSFCSVGGARGAYDPPVKGECNRIADPYADLKAPRPGKCIPRRFYDRSKKAATTPKNITPTTTLNGRAMQLGTEQIRLLKTYGADLVNVPTSENVISHNRILRPGTYCGGLTIDGNNVIFKSGVYIIKDGPLTIKNKAFAFGRGVTFVMHGAEAVVRIEEGARVFLKAPKKGRLAGMAFMQDIHIKKPTALSSTPPSAGGGGQTDKVTPTVNPRAKAEGLNLLRSGGKMSVLGTLYFPTQAIDISGNSRIGAQSPATSFIAYQVTFAGATRATVGVDHVAAGLPPLLPQADDAARLLK